MAAWGGMPQLATCKPFPHQKSSEQHSFPNKNQEQQLKISYLGNQLSWHEQSLVGPLFCIDLPHDGRHYLLYRDGQQRRLEPHEGCFFHWRICGGRMHCGDDRGFGAVTAYPWQFSCTLCKSLGLSTIFVGQLQILNTEKLQKIYA